MVCFPGCHGREGREEGKKERDFGQGLGRKEEDMSVGEATKSTSAGDCGYIRESATVPGRSPCISGTSGSFTSSRVVPTGGLTM